MAGMIWKAPTEVVEMLLEVKKTHHSPRLDPASLAVCFDESKPFVKNRINLGRLSKFSALARLYQRDRHDFCLTIPSVLWTEILPKENDRMAYLDLQLTRCDLEYETETYEENNKKKKVTDEFGRLKFTNQPKIDDEGNYKWIVQPMDLEVFGKNVRRYGLWLEELRALEEAIVEHSADRDTK